MKDGFTPDEVPDGSEVQEEFLENLKEEQGPARLTPEQQELVRRHFALVGVHLRNWVPTPRLPRRDREYDELFQEGCVALVRAAARYDPTRNGVFAAYALPRIRGAIYRAIHDKFTLIRLTQRAAQKARKRPDRPIPHGPVSMLEISEELEESMVVEHRPSEPKETIRHVIRRRYELAVACALEQMRERVWRQSNPCEIMGRIAKQRLLIATERQRTTLGQIAREFGVSASRVRIHERRLVQAVQEALADDPQMPVLLAMAREDADGQDAFMDAEKRAGLCRAEVDAFEGRFRQMAPPRQAELIYSLIERSADCVPEVARNLFRMTLRIDDDSARIVA
jgi:RNA polymerase sigma factor (sigma-70 family)